MAVAVYVRYRGERGLVSVFAGMLEAEGLALDWQPLAGPGGVGEVLIGVVEPTISDLSLDAILNAARAAAARFRERFPDRA